MDAPAEAYALCEHVLGVLWKVVIGAIAAMWVHIVWIHHSISKRLDRVAEKLLKEGS